jgi:hypothetical protein
MENPDKKVLGVRHYFNINELRDLVKHPHKTIAVCHVPRKFDLEGCVDKGHFYQRRKYYKSKIEGVDDMWKYSELGVIPGFVDSDDLKGMGMPILDLEDEGDCIKTVEELEKNGFSTELYVEQIGNRGNKDLRSLFGSLGITKAVSGHFHESVHSANDSKGNPVEAGKFVRDLFWMGSHLDEKKIGILSVSGPMVSYENVVLS